MSVADNFHEYLRRGWGEAEALAKAADDFREVEEEVEQVVEEVTQPQDRKPAAKSKATILAEARALAGEPEEKPSGVMGNTEIAGDKEETKSEEKDPEEATGTPEGAGNSDEKEEKANDEAPVEPEGGDSVEDEEGSDE